MSSCSPMLTPTYGITPTEQQLALPAGAILRGRYNRRKAIYYGCLPASALLGIIILVHTSILAIWMLREYYFFDFKCAILRYEFGSAIDVDEETTTRNSAHNDASIRHSRARIPRQSHLSHSSPPTSLSSFNNDWRIEGFRIMQLKRATTLSLHRRRRSVACDSRKSGIYTHCQQHVIWADRHNSWSRNRKLLGELRTISKRSQRNEESEQQSASFNILHSSNVGDPKKANNDRWIPANRNEQPRSFPSESVRVRKTRSQQRANVNQFGRPVRPRVDLPTSSPKLMYRAYSPQVNNSHIRDEKIVNRNTITRIKTTPENVSRNGARLKSTQQTHTTKTARLGPLSVIRNRNGTRLKTNNRKPPTKGVSNNRQLARRKPALKSSTRSGLGSAPKRKPDQNDRKKLVPSSMRNATGRRLQPKKHKSGESWESNEAKPTKKRYHFLSGPSTSTRRNTTHRTSWINGIIDPADENFSNKGDIRFYRGRLANKKPKRLKGLKSTAAPGSAARLGKLSGLQQHTANEERKSSDNEENGRVISRRPKNATSSEDSTEIKKKAQRKWKTAEDVVRRPSPRVKSSKEHLKEGSGSREADSSSESQFSLGTKLTKAPETIKSSSTTTPPSRTTTTAVNVLLTSTLHEVIEDGYSVDEMHPRLDSYERLYHSASLGPIPRKSTIGPMIGIVRKQIDGVEVKRPLRLTNKKLTTPFMVETTTELSEEMIQKRRENFIAQLATFSDSALCIARTLLDLWCVAECAAAIPFVIGIWCPTRCLFAAHIILDTLFLVIAFIYSITLAVYSVILYMLVEDMSIWTLLRWLGFAAAVNSLLAIYVIIFIITLRCCELVVDNGESLKPRQRLTSHYSYQEVRTLDVNGGNAV